MNRLDLTESQLKNQQKKYNSFQRCQEAVNCFYVNKYALEKPMETNIAEPDIKWELRKSNKEQTKMMLA